MLEDTDARDAILEDIVIPVLAKPQQKYRCARSHSVGHCTGNCVDAHQAQLVRQQVFGPCNVEVLIDDVQSAAFVTLDPDPQAQSMS